MTCFSSHLDVGFISTGFYETEPLVECDRARIDKECLEFDRKVEVSGFIDDNAHAGRSDALVLTFRKDVELVHFYETGIALDGQNADVDP